MALKVAVPATNVRRSMPRTDESTVVYGRRSSPLIPAVTLTIPDEVPNEQSQEEEYSQVIEEAKLCIGHGATVGAFPEEWDAQLLVDSGRTSEGHRLIIFCPRFLAPVVKDPDELDRAFRFLLLTMDGIAMHEEYVFVYCYMGMDWSDPRMMQRLRVAYDILPSLYAKNLRRFYILHVTSGFRVTMWTFWAWLSKHLWEKIEYVRTLDGLCERLHPHDKAARAELRRRFPQIVQRHDAELNGLEPPVTFGVPLGRICGGFGVDFMDKTTGRWYPRLPPALIFLCEAMEREAADDDFASLFSADAASVYNVVQAVDHGEPLDRDIPMSALWCVLKLFLDCLPQPLLSFELIDELKKQKITKADTQAHRQLLADTFHRRLPPEMAYVALYVASFLHTMCETAQEKQGSSSKSSSSKAGPEALSLDALGKVLLTPTLVAQVFAPSFLRPKSMSEEHRHCRPVAEAMVETLIRNAEEPELWIGKEALLQLKADGSSSSDEGPSA